MSDYRVATLEEIEELSDGRCPWRPVRHHFAIQSFGINSWSGHDTGDRIINEHAEDDDNEELYFVASGRARFELGGETVDAPAGTFVSVPPDMQRTAFAEQAGTTIIAIGGTPGRVYEPNGWELFAPAGALYQQKRYAEAADAGRALAEQYPEYPDLLYNVACCESLAGREADAIEHLRQAIAKSDRTREYAREDTDFDAIRDSPAFQALLG